jgi:hypothetical protein
MSPDRLKKIREIINDCSSNQRKIWIDDYMKVIDIYIHQFKENPYFESSSRLGDGFSVTFSIEARDHNRKYLVDYDLIKKASKCKWKLTIEINFVYRTFYGNVHSNIESDVSYPDREKIIKCINKIW